MFARKGGPVPAEGPVRVGAAVTAGEGGRAEFREGCGLIQEGRGAGQSGRVKQSGEYVQPGGRC